MATRTEIIVMTQTDRNGPWTPVQIVIKPKEFLEAKSQDKYIMDLVRNSVMGSDIISIDYKYTKEQANKDLQEN